MRILVALGGNALAPRGTPMTVANQRHHALIAAQALSKLVKLGHQLIITFGNGPQVGLLGLQALAGPKDGDFPLDILVAESEGLIGYIIEQALRNTLGPHALIATLLTQTLVNADDAAFLRPTKPVGQIYDENTAKKYAADRGWQVAPDGDHWRRVVASPEPIEIVQIEIISLLIERGVTVICAGGGGAPVAKEKSGDLIGMEAVVDKDLVSSLLAQQIKADYLLLLTDVEAVFQNFGKPDQQRMATIASDALIPDQFPAGSMRPKLEAAKRFVRETGKDAAIGRLDDACDILSGAAGTMILPCASSMG